jgi:hypothetical protein
MSQSCQALVAQALPLDLFGYRNARVLRVL